MDEAAPNAPEEVRPPQRESAGAVIERLPRGDVEPPPAPEQPRVSWLRRAILPVLILLLAGGTAAVLVATRPTVERKVVPERVWRVSATTVSIADIQPKLKLLGEIVAGRSVELRPLVSGRVIAVGDNYVDGGVIKRGDLLIAIDPFDYKATVRERAAQLAEAEARLRELRAERDGARALLGRDRESVRLSTRERKRREDLRRRGTGSQKALDDARMALTAIEQRVISRQQLIAQMAARIAQQKAVIDQRRVALARANRNLTNTRLTAPFDAFVADTGTAIGKQVGVGDKVARLIDVNRLDTRFHMSDAEFARLVAAGGYKGRAATVTWHTQTRNFVFAARIERSGSEVDAASGGINLYARIAKTGLATVLRPGIFVTVEVPDQVYRKVARAPASALHGNDMVYVIEKGRLVPRRVALVANAGTDVLLRGGLVTGDRVVTTDFAEIGPGVKVELR